MVNKPIKKYIEKAWGVYNKNLMKIISANILISLIPIVLVVIGLLPLLPVIFPLVKVSVAPEPEVVVETILASGKPNLAFLGIMIFLAVLTSFVLKAGLIKMYAQAIKGKTKIGIIFRTAERKFWTILCANIFVLILTFLILLVCVIPLSLLSVLIGFSLIPVGAVILLLVEMFFVFVNQAIVIDNKRAMDSVKKSFSFAKSNYPRVLVIFGIFMIISMILSLIDEYITGFLGSIITSLMITPVVMITLTYFYLKKGK